MSSNAHELAITHLKNNQINTAYTLLIDLAESSKKTEPIRSALLYVLASECKRRQDKDTSLEFTEAANLFLKNASKSSQNPKSSLLCASKCFVRAGDFDKAKHALEKSKQYVLTHEKSESRHIVVIEDSAAISLKLKGYSEKLGYVSIDAFENGKSGITFCKSLFEKNIHPIILLDMGLPDINGDKVAKQLLEMKPDLQIIVITADEKSSKRVNDTISAGVTAFIQKPFTIDEVKSALDLAENEYSLLKK